MRAARVAAALAAVGSLALAARATAPGNSSSGGAVSPPLLPGPFAFVSQWLPSGATVTSLRDAIYFPSYQQPRPVLVLAAWAAALFGAMLIASHRRRTSPGDG